MKSTVHWKPIFKWLAFCSICAIIFCLFFYPFLNPTTDESAVYKNLKLLTNSAVKRSFYAEKVEIIQYDLYKPVPEEMNMVGCIQLRNALPPYFVCLHDDDLVSNRVRRQLNWEPETQRLIKLFFSNYSDTTFVDLGSNVGLHTLYAASLRPDIDVIAVEPFPVNAQRLHKGAVINKVQGQIKLIMSALSNRRHMVTFKEKIGSAGENSLVRKDGDKNSWIEKGLNINALLLDDLTPLVKKPTVFLKIDVEGVECFLFSNAYKFFHSFRIPFLIIKFRHTASQVDWCVEMMLTFLKEFSFRPFAYPFENLYPNSSLNFAEWKKWKDHDIFFVQF